MEKSRSQVLIFKGNEILILLQVCKELIVFIYVPRKTGKNNGGIFHVNVFPSDLYLLIYLD